MTMRLCKESYCNDYLGRITFQPWLWLGFESSFAALLMPPTSTAALQRQGALRPKDGAFGRYSALDGFTYTGSEEGGATFGHWTAEGPQCCHACFAL